MDAKRSRFPAVVLALFAATLFLPTLRADTISLAPPSLPGAGPAKGLEFTSYQFDVYLVPLGDCDTDFVCGNILANDHEYFSSLVLKPCGSGRDPHCPNPRQYERLNGYTYEDTYTSVAIPPNQPIQIDATFTFSGADASGIPLAVTVTGGGQYTLTLTDSQGNNVPLDLTLTDQTYTLNYQTNSLNSDILFAPAMQPATAAEPASFGLLLLALPGVAWKVRRTLDFV